MEYPIRINKYLRDKGLASRREADKLIENGSVFINGEKAENGMLVNESDKVEARSKQKEYKYIAYYKSRGLATQDLAGKKSVVSEWKDKGLYPIGRLDKESEGLLLLTNDGRFVTEVLSENSKYEKEYIVTVKETLRPGIVRIFQAGMKTKSLGKLLPAKAEIINKITKITANHLAIVNEIPEISPKPNERISRTIFACHVGVVTTIIPPGFVMRIIS